MTWSFLNKVISLINKSGKIAGVVFVAALMATSASAQTANSVTLKYDDGDGVTGEIISFADGLFRLNSLFGEVTVPADSVVCIGKACPEGTTPALPEVRLVLTSKDGSSKVSGNLIETTEKHYIVETDVGELRLNISDVNCSGVGCIPSTETVFAVGGDVVLTSSGSSVEGTLIDLLENAYVVEVMNIGVVRMSKDAFACSGPGCPNAD